MTYPRFIEVHTPENGNGDYAQKNSRTCINVDSICMFYPDPTEEQGCLMSFIGSDGGSYQDVSESYEELKELISNAGCHIEKGDPRIDQSRPLTKEDIKEMGVGEPVWHSNKMLWGIITNWCDLESGFYCTLVTHKSVVDMDEDDLVKYPLYRMKR